MTQVRRALSLRAEVAAKVPATAMIMAAGLGKRMRPLTATRPKPLIEVNGKALLDHVLEKLVAAGVRKVVVNVHYLADALEAHLASRAHGLDVVISDERNLLLETGGGLVQAEPLIDADPFLSLNSDNLWVDGRDGIGHFGLLDFQDAVAGHPAYDLASVLEDARRDVPAEIEREMIDHYMSATGQGARFERAYWALAAQRNTRILGVFTRLWKRDNKPHYRRFQPRMWGLLERDLARPGLEPLRDWFDGNIAPEYRRDPWRDAE